MPDVPEIKFPISIRDLNRIGDAAGQTIDVSAGGDTSHGTTRVPELPRVTAFWARVYRAGSGSAAGCGGVYAGSGSCQVPYRWQAVRHDACGQWEDVPGLAGEIDSEPAYEANGMGVVNGTVVWLRLENAALDPVCAPPRTVRQYVFTAGGGSSADSTGIGIAFGPYCIQQRVTDVKCDPLIGFCVKYVWEIWTNDGRMIPFSNFNEALAFHTDPNGLNRNGCVEGLCAAI